MGEHGVNVNCRGCGDTQVDNKGHCVSVNCSKSHNVNSNKKKDYVEVKVEALAILNMVMDGKTIKEVHTELNISQGKVRQMLDVALLPMQKYCRWFKFELPVTKRAKDIVNNSALIRELVEEAKYFK